MIFQLGIVIGTLSTLFLLQIIVRSEVEGLPETKTPDAAPSSKNATAIALQNCEKYAEYRNVQKWIPAMASKPGYWYNTTDCVNVLPRNTSITSQEKKNSRNFQTFLTSTSKLNTCDFDKNQIAHIGYSKDDDFKNVTWLCGGSLISEKFVLSTAVCGEGSPSLKPRWVLLGDLNANSKDDDSKPAVYDIVKIHNHPNRTKAHIGYDISLFELNTNVVTSPYVRPACLYTPTSNLVNTRGSITGWGRTDRVGDSSDRLLKAVITVYDDEKCTKVYNSSKTPSINYDPNSMICAGDSKDGKDSCQGDSGGPLQMPIKGLTCMWNIFGLTSFGRECAVPDYPGVYTKVAYHLDWIQSIVWP